MEDPEQIFLKRLEILIKRNACCPQQRIIVALAGAPGSGKSTIATALTQRFNATNVDQLQVVPMCRMPISKTRSTFTIDSESFLRLIQTLTSTPVTKIDELEGVFWVPSFDHAIKDPVEHDIRISSSQKLVLIEGSYLLLDGHPWRLIRELVTETWFISVQRDVSRERLIARHIAAGIEPDRVSAAARAETNDLLNWDLINKKLLCPEVTVESK